MFIHTIGYGNSDLDGLIARSKPFNIDHFVDVRTNAYSRYQPDFRDPEFSKNLKISGYKYTFMGDLIGGKPDWEEVQVAGKVEGELLIKDPRFLRGLELIQNQIAKGAQNMALLCGCGDPMSCHRGRWIGPELLTKGIESVHILTDGSTLTQSQARSAVYRQSSLFAMD